MRISKSISQEGRVSIAFHLIRTNGKSKIRELTLRELTSLIPFFTPTLARFLMDTFNLEGAETGPPDKEIIYVNLKPKILSDVSSKTIRLSRNEKDPLCYFKSGTILTPRESLNYFYNLNRLPSVRHRNIILKILHGDVYTNERLHRFGLIDNPSCPRCDQIETIEHKFATCEYISRIWAETSRLTNKWPSPNTDQIQELILANGNLDQTTLRIHAEILYRISLLPKNPQYLVIPKIFVACAVKYLIKMEKTRSVKTDLEHLLT